MIKTPSNVLSVSRRDALKKTGIALCASMLPLASSMGQPVANGVRYRRYNATGPHGPRMLKSYAKAVRAMLALPPEDPRNWYRHAIVHTVDCPHGNWWFLPWHRGYLGWFEQICRELSGDPQFALPYWDWTAEPKVPDGMFDDVLDPNHSAYIPTAPDFEARLKRAIENSGYWTSPGGVFQTRSQYGQLLMRRMRFDPDLMFDIVTDPSGRLFYDQPGARGLRREHPEFSPMTAAAVSIGTVHAALAAQDFPAFGSFKAPNHSAMAGFGILEAQPHNLVHRCVGSRDCNFVDAMGFMTDMLSPVDPIFFLHHGNMDRLWDVWTRKQQALGLPTLPAGSELRTDLPDDQKSPEEKNTDYFRWASEPMLFFVDSKGAPVAKTRGGDYEAMEAFNYDYEPGSGEDVVAQAKGKPKGRLAARRVFSGKVVDRLGRGGQAASGLVQLPAGTIEQATAAGSVLVANLTLNFPHSEHNDYVIVVNGPEDLSQVDAASPFYVGAIAMFGHHAHGAALSYVIPLGQKLGQVAADGNVRLRIVPMHAAHEGMDHGGAVELLAVNVEVY
ncbi:tyrosinase family protein [Massilia agilis]|uniref:Tyrosinase family protein n=1 Tax=Massilia agilis TaxID=1811226 RepID=A0ABT2DI07_9BURK|nr:tyrosinase family protein [Massilia agilis]MCS0810096.1 tyrosinase family protein [Massilia agilis]